VYSTTRFVEHSRGESEDSSGALNLCAKGQAAAAACCAKRARAKSLSRLPSHWCILAGRLVHYDHVHILFLFLIIIIILIIIIYVSLYSECLLLSVFDRLCSVSSSTVSGRSIISVGAPPSTKDSTWWIFRRCLGTVDQRHSKATVSSNCSNIISKYSTVFCHSAKLSSPSL
jgi:hypothetical protein